jgi:hypothetical protein
VGKLEVTNLVRFRKLNIIILGEILFRSVPLNIIILGDIYTLRNETESQFIEYKTRIVHNADCNSDISALLVHAHSNYMANRF